MFTDNYNGLCIIFKLFTGVLLSFEDLKSFGISDGAGNDMGVGLDSDPTVHPPTTAIIRLPLFQINAYHQPVPGNPSHT
jgi:hypothetical protein